MHRRASFNSLIADRLLADRVANRCSNPDCQATTSGPQTDPARATNIGVAAHITAAAGGGPRYDADLTSDRRSSADNGIWLCQSCAALIDRDTQRFTPGLLRGWKEVAEDRARNRIGKTFQPEHETEAQRKMKKILEMKKPGQMVTLRWLRAPAHVRMLGPVQGQAEAFVQACTEDFVTVQIAGSGSNRSFSLKQIRISWDDKRHRPALEIEP